MIVLELHSILSIFKGDNYTQGMQSLIPVKHVYYHYWGRGGVSRLMSSSVHATKPAPLLRTSASLIIRIKDDAPLVYASLLLRL